MGRYDVIKELFDKSDTNVIIDATRKQETQNRIEELGKECHVSAAVNKWQFTKMQIYHMDKTIFMIHLIACLGTILLGGRCREWEQICVIVSGALGALSLFEVGNLFSSGMTELGESCYFNVHQLVAFQMVYSGLISLTALLITTVSTGLKYQLRIMEISIYILVPFVFTECICMTVMLMEIGRRNLLILIAVGVLSVFFWSVLTTIPILYEASALFFWGVALIAGIGILAIQIRRFFSALDKGDILCAD